MQTASQGNTARPFTSPSEPLARTSPYVLAISSGKGGVGKTNVVINLAVEIQRRGLRVLVFDADLGLYETFRGYVGSYGLAGIPHHSLHLAGTVLQHSLDIGFAGLGLPQVPRGYQEYLVGPVAGPKLVYRNASLTGIHLNTWIPAFAGMTNTLRAIR